jgi:hypothetical protein
MPPLEKERGRPPSDIQLYTDLLKVDNKNCFDFEESSGAILIIARKAITALDIQETSSGNDKPSIKMKLRDNQRLNLDIVLTIYIGELVEPIPIYLLVGDVRKYEYILHPNPEHGGVSRILMCCLTGITDVGDRESESKALEGVDGLLLPNSTFRMWLRTEMRLCTLTQLSRYPDTARSIYDFIQRMIPQDFKWEAYTLWRSANIMELERDAKEESGFELPLDTEYMASTLHQLFNDLNAHIDRVQHEELALDRDAVSQSWKEESQAESFQQVSEALKISSIEFKNAQTTRNDAFKRFDQENREMRVSSSHNGWKEQS